MSETVSIEPVPAPAKVVDESSVPSSGSLGSSLSTTLSATPPSPSVEVGVSAVVAAISVYRHQVSGHLPMFFWRKGTICKPAFPKELQFYTDVAERIPQLMPFTPHFFGTTELRELAALEAMDSKTELEGSDSQDTWSLQCLLRNRPKISKLGDKYLILEDLTYGFRCPCVLDLKVGQRQHGDDEPPEKIKSKTEKCNATTSKSLGLRLCGMKLYQPEDGTYRFENKYYGRSLVDESFKETLKQFFTSSTGLRTDCVKSLLEQLKAMTKVLLAQSTYRFYSSSVLMVYDGYDSGDSMEDVALPLASASIPFGESAYASKVKGAKLRLIDFAHTSLAPKDSGADTNILFGLENLRVLLEDLLVLASSTSSLSTRPEVRKE